MLASGLPERVQDEEKLARFLTSSSYYNSKMVKPAAFLPNPTDSETSVFRHGSDPCDNLWAIGMEHAAQGRNIHGVAIVNAHHVRAIGLEVIACEPPPLHAGIRNWPEDPDPELQKAKQKDLANLIAKVAELLKK